MSERANLISKLQSEFGARAAYIQSKVSTLVPSQIRALRLKSHMPRQSDLAHAAEMHQSRISMFETPGANPTLSTLSAIAAGLKVGLKIEFVPFSEMLDWENGFSQDQFYVVGIDNDLRFLAPDRVSIPVMSMEPTVRTNVPAMPVVTVPFIPQYRQFYEEPADLEQVLAIGSWLNIEAKGYETSRASAMIPYKASPQTQPLGGFEIWKSLPSQETYQTTISTWGER